MILTITACSTPAGGRGYTRITLNPIDLINLGYDEERVYFGHVTVTHSYKQKGSFVEGAALCGAAGSLLGKKGKRTKTAVSAAALCGGAQYAMTNGLELSDYRIMTQDGERFDYRDKKGIFQNLDCVAFKVNKGGRVIRIKIVDNKYCSSGHTESKVAIVLLRLIPSITG